jgi:hypothetical protein
VRRRCRRGSIVEGRETYWRPTFWRRRAASRRRNSTTPMATNSEESNPRRRHGNFPMIERRSL